MSKITSFEQIGGKPDEITPLMELISSLANLHPLEYDQKRKEIAKKHNIRIATLDELVTKTRQTFEDNQNTNKQFKEWEVTPWSAPVHGRELLNQTLAILQRYVIADIESLHAAVAWAALSWLVDHATVLPMAMITAPEKGCGKSVLLDVLGALVLRPLQGGSITQSALFRSIELWKPTLLIDEADSFMKENEAMRGLLNSGHTRGSAFRILSEEVGGKLQPVRFSTWGAKAIAGIKLETLDATLTSRSIILPMRRKLPSELSENFRHGDKEPFKVLQSMFYRWSLDNGDAFSKLRPVLPGLSNRDSDNWEPLLAIAELAGGEWPARIKTAALKIVGKAGESMSLDAELLRDIREVFSSKKVERISSINLLEALTTDDLASWRTYNRGTPMTARQLANRLRPYGISPDSVRVKGAPGNPKGYKLEDFEEAFLRYIPAPIAPSVLSVTQLQLACEKDYRTFSTVTQEPDVTDKTSTKPSSTEDCHLVTARTKCSGKPGEIVEEVF